MTASTGGDPNPGRSAPGGVVVDRLGRAGSYNLRGAATKRTAVIDPIRTDPPEPQWGVQTSRKCGSAINVRTPTITARIDHAQ
jgi:hypothetical protein